MQTYPLLLHTHILHYRICPKSKNVCGEYTFYAPENVSLSEAKRIALERAKLQALADEFGTVISQVNTSVVKDDNGKADSHFFHLAARK